MDQVDRDGAGEDVMEVVIGGPDFARSMAFFVDELGFRPLLLTPADDPSLAVLAGPGIRLRLDRNRPTTPVTLVVEGEGPTLRAPDGSTVIRTPPRRLSVPDAAPDLAVSHADADGVWVTGRAGMRYRDLIPSRWGGRFIASHIEVCDGGPVPDRVHHHDIRLQLIVCHRGWVDVVYEDQGPPFRMEPGDLVLQPPGIRHRVLASSAGARVVEIGCPAEHDTLFDHDLTLPTTDRRPDRSYGGQRFVRHRASSPWTPAGGAADWVHQESGVAAATAGLAAVHLVRPGPGAPPGASLAVGHDGEFRFLFVLDGSGDLTLGPDPVPSRHAGSSREPDRPGGAKGDRVERLTEGSSVALPPGSAATLTAADPDREALHLLDVRLPA